MRYRTDSSLRRLSVRSWAAAALSSCSTGFRITLVYSAFMFFLSAVQSCFTV